MSDEQLMTAEEVARYLNIHPRTVTNMADRGELPASKVAGRWRFRKVDIDEYLERQKPKPKED
jgi:excisionase family DNA binding protein